MGRKIGSACKDNSLSIRCKDEKQCDCKTSKKSYFYKHPSSEKAKSLRWQFIKKKKFRGKTTDRCFIYKKKGHFTRNCPKKARAAHLFQQAKSFADLDLSDIESQFSLEDDYSPDSMLALPYISSEDEDEDTSNPLDQYNTDLVTSHLVQPTPTARIHILPEPFARPIPVIAYFDIGAAATIINPILLPPSHWKATQLTFRVINCDLFQITKISNPITIQIFPNLKIQHQVLGCTLTGKDLLLRFDLLHKLSSLRWSSQGLSLPPHFLPWTHIPNLYHLSYDPILQLLQSVCASSHATFDHPHPLWTNENYFVKLPFKVNENANPTTASHRGMAPKLYSQALEELEQLKQNGLIEPTTSPWAYEAFYVNKRAEQVQNKLRLVINYQPLNCFLAYSKFPLPQKANM